MERTSTPMGTSSVKDLLLLAHPDIELTELAVATDINVICEGQFKDADGEPFYVYTVAGEINGNRIEMLDHVRKVILGATVAGDAIIIHARDRKEADWLAINGLMDTIDATRLLEAHGALDPARNAGTIVEARATPKVS